MHNQAWTNTWLFAIIRLALCMHLRLITSRRSIALTALALAMGAVVFVAAPVSAKSKYVLTTKCTKSTHWYYVRVNGVKKKHYYTKTTCKKVWVLAKSVSSPSFAKARYDIMKSTGSSRSLPRGLVAVCGNGKTIYSPVTSTTCAGKLQGVAWCANPKLSKYCPKY